MRLLFILLLALSNAPASGQAATDPVRFFVWPLEDLRAIPDGITTRRLAVGAAAGATVLLLSSLDRTLDHKVDGLSENAGLRVAQEFGNARAVRPAAALVFIGGLMAGDERLQDAAYTSLEAVILANLGTNSLKSITGRARPWQREGPTHFSPFSGYTSFPSGHATTAWAALTPFAYYYGGTVAVVLYAVAGLTSLSRMATGVHWFSDVVAGAGIGFATGRLLSRRHASGVRLRVVPLTDGVSAGLNLRF